MEELHNPQLAEELQGAFVRERIVEGAPTTLDIPNTVLKVATQSRPAATAGAVANVIRSGQHAVVQAIGPGAVNQAVKAIAIARSYMREEGIDLVFYPSFLTVHIADQERTAICLHVQARPSML